MLYAINTEASSSQDDVLSLRPEREYSLIEHLAKIAGGGEWKKMPLAMFTAYFDASGDNSCPYVVAVCGFVANADAWIGWESEWLDRLRLSGLTELHMKDLRKGTARAQSLITDLCGIIRHHVAHKFGVIVVNSEIGARVSKSEQRRFRINAYSLAGRTVARQLREWSSSWGGRFPGMVFEKGDAGRKDLRHLLVSQGYPEPQFRPKRTYIDNKSGIVHERAVPLQAADLFANLQFCNIRDSAVNNTPMARLPYDLDRIPGEPGEVELPRYDFIKQGIEEAEKPIVIPGVKVNVKAGQPNF